MRSASATTEAAPPGRPPPPWPEPRGRPRRKRPRRAGAPPAGPEAPASKAAISPAGKVRAISLNARLAAGSRPSWNMQNAFTLQKRELAGDRGERVGVFLHGVADKDQGSDLGAPGFIARVTSTPADLRRSAAHVDAAHQLLEPLPAGDRNWTPGIRSAHGNRRVAHRGRQGRRRPGTFSPAAIGQGSQVGCRLMVASRAKISRPRPDWAGAGTFFAASLKAAMSLAAAPGQLAVLVLIHQRPKLVTGLLDWAPCGQATSRETQIYSSPSDANSRRSASGMAAKPGWASSMSGGALLAS